MKQSPYNLPAKITVPVILGACALWLFCVRGFIFGELNLIGDATSYYDHIKFFMTNIGHGVYPLWDPEWYHGVPNEFFLRRFGSFNPFYLSILFFDGIGLSYHTAYLLFLAIYWLLGAVGFYLIARATFKNDISSLAAFLILLFSTVGTRIFDSFIIFVLTPMIWAFFFLIHFSRTTKSYALAGLSFCLMILMTTYIPFYFLLIMASFLICWLIFYTRDIPLILRKWLRTVFTHKILTGICLLAVLGSLIPGLMMFKAAKSGQVQMPARHTAAGSENMLAMQMQTLGGGGVVTPLTPEVLFDHLKQIQLEQLYIPVFAFVLLLLGLQLRFTRLTGVLGLWFLIIFLTGLNDASLLYPFLYKHVFFFKYFRNSLFYLWLALTPIFIFLVCHQFDQFLEDIQQNNSGKVRALIFLIIPIAAFLAYIKTLDQPLWSSYAIIILSVILLGSLVFNHARRHQKIVFAILTALIVAQPLEVYHHLARNAVGGVDHKYYAEHFPDIFHGTAATKPSRVNLSSLTKASGSLYYTTPQYNDLYKNIPETVLNYYLSHKFLVYDHVRGIQDRETALREFPGLIVNESNLALIDAAQSDITPVELPEIQPHVIRVTAETEGFKLINYSANAISFKTSFQQPKFLVYNDNYHPDWKASTDGKKTPIYKANLAFKGLWVPAGRHVHHLTFGSQKRRWLNGAFLLLFHAMLWITVALRIKNV